MPDYMLLEHKSLRHVPYPPPPPENFLVYSEVEFEVTLNVIRNFMVCDIVLIYISL